MISKSDSGNQNKKEKIWFGCERCTSKFQKNLNNDEGFRGSKKCDCSFQLKSQQISIVGLEWRLMVITGMHKHLIVEYLEEHSYVGRLS